MLENDSKPFNTLIIKRKIVHFVESIFSTVKKTAMIIFSFSFFSFVYSQIEPSVEAKKLLHQNDLDSDGVLCKIECSEEILDKFYEIDLNKDNYLTVEELDYYLKLKSEEK